MSLRFFGGLGPSSVEIHTGLGRALAGQNRMLEAVDLGRRVVWMTREQDPRMLGVLAAAQAAAGDFDRAVTTVRKAIRWPRLVPGTCWGACCRTSWTSTASANPTSNADDPW